MMSYSGKLKIQPPLTEPRRLYLEGFLKMRHVKRDVEVLKEKYPELKNRDLGIEGEFFVPKDNLDEYRDPSILNQNEPPSSQPYIICPWEVDKKGQTLYLEYSKPAEEELWLQYLIKNFFTKWGVLLNGEIHWTFGPGDGDEEEEGEIIVTNNVLTTTHRSLLDDDEEEEKEYTDIPD